MLIFSRLGLYHCTTFAGGTVIHSKSCEDLHAGLIPVNGHHGYVPCLGEMTANSVRLVSDVLTSASCHHCVVTRHVAQRDYHIVNGIISNNAVQYACNIDQHRTSLIYFDTSVKQSMIMKWTRCRHISGVYLDLPRKASSTVAAKVIAKRLVCTDLSPRPISPLFSLSSFSSLTLSSSTQGCVHYQHASVLTRIAPSRTFPTI